MLFSSWSWKVGNEDIYIRIICIPYRQIIPFPRLPSQTFTIYFSGLKQCYSASSLKRLWLCAHGRRFRAFSKTFSSLLSFWCPVYTDQGKIFSMYWISSNFCSKLLVFASVFAWKHKWKRSKTLPCARSLTSKIWYQFFVRSLWLRQRIFF